MSLGLDSLPQLTAALRRGDLSISAYLDELESRVAAREPDVLALLPEPGRFARLRREAAALENRFPAPEQRPSLFCVPVGVKDIFHISGFATRAGSNLPIQALRGPEAHCVSALKRAGALILGKTVTTEFAYFGPGPTRNPHRLDHTPGGSSSGSAAAVAAGFCPLALGTQTIGSINRPAAFCGVVGFKPSQERISRTGVIPLSPSVDHVGFFTADVTSARMAGSVVIGDWRAEAGEGTARDKPRKPVLGVPEGPYLDNASGEALEHFGAVCRVLSGDGYSIVYVPAMPDFDEIRRRHNDIVAAEAARVHAKWFSRYADLYHPKTDELIRRGQEIGDADLAEALTGRARLRAELTQLMDTQGVDVWIAPAARGPAPRGLASTGDPVMNLPWTHSGMPSLTVPAGRTTDGLPLAVQWVGRMNADEELLAWADDSYPQ